VSRIRKRKRMNIEFWLGNLLENIYFEDREEDGMVPLRWYYRNVSLED
jgi:hypothetical protein